MMRINEDIKNSMNTRIGLNGKMRIQHIFTYKRPTSSRKGRSRLISYRKKVTKSAPFWVTAKKAGLQQQANVNESTYARCQIQLFCGNPIYMVPIVSIQDMQKCPR